MMRISSTVLALLLLLVAAPSYAVINTQAGTAGAQFLKFGAGARAGAMADSFSAIADDAHAAYYNPAGLSQLTGSQIAGAHTAYFQGVSYEVLDFAVPFARQEQFSRHAVAFGIYHLSVNDIERRTGDSTDPVGTFGASDGAYALSYAYGPSRRLSFGATGKYIVQNLDSYSGTAFALDLGTLYHLNPEGERPMTLAAVLRNAGTDTGYVSGAKDPLPVSLTLGLGLQAVPKRVKLNFEVTKYRDTDIFGALGGEYRHPFSDATTGALRFGYSSQRKDTPGLNGISLGGGVSFHRASFDVAWVPFGGLGDTFRYSLLVKF